MLETWEVLNSLIVVGCNQWGFFLNLKFKILKILKINFKIKNFKLKFYSNFLKKPKLSSSIERCEKKLVIIHRKMWKKGQSSIGRLEKNW
jgi:hypothetical protein